MTEGISDLAVRTQLTREVMATLQGWGVPAEAQRMLLGLPGDLRARKLNQFRSGQALPDEPEVLARAQLLIQIGNAVATLYPHNVSVANYWVTTENRFFGRRTPLDVMLEGGLAAMERVIAHLNGTTEWY